MWCEKKILHNLYVSVLSEHPSCIDLINGSLWIVVFTWLYNPTFVGILAATDNPYLLENWRHPHCCQCPCCCWNLCLLLALLCSWCPQAGIPVVAGVLCVLLLPSLFFLNIETTSVLSDLSLFLVLYCTIRISNNGPQKLSPNIGLEHQFMEPMDIGLQLVNCPALLMKIIQ